MRAKIFQVDAFTDRLFHGNPAAVCLLDAWPADETLQAVAAENNLSETAFVVPDGDEHELRWFTPEVEVDLCGHATLAAAFVLLGYTEGTRQRVTFRTRSGALEVRRDGRELSMRFPLLPAEPVTPPPGLEEALGAAPARVLAAQDYLAVFEAREEVAALRPDMERLGEMGRRGVIVTAPAEQGEADFVSRFFAPGVGVPEDPVTGSAHCTLAPYWGERLNRERLVGRQISPRGGTVTCRLAGDHVFLSGRAVLYLEGTLRT